MDARRSNSGSSTGQSCRAVVLMYHAVADEADAGADAHYSVSRAGYEDQLKRVADLGMSVSHVSALAEAAPSGNLTKTVALTFDDGHASNAFAAEMLARRGWSADFFVNPSSVGQPHFLSWSDLREMADMGMSIQSHGQHHRFLDELDAAQVDAELLDSKRAIEDNLGRPVSVFAPPGGRMARDMGKVAQRLGYRMVCTSRVGLWSVGADAWNIPRLAVLASTSQQQFLNWIEQRRGEMFKQQLRYELLTSAKRMLGNGVYQKMRAGLLGTGRGA